LIFLPTGGRRAYSLLMAFLGQRNQLVAVRESTAGLYLDGEELGEILLPNRYVPHDYQSGALLGVFLYRDSEDRLVATTEVPFAEVGQFACLRVLSVNERVGAFLDWGLPKDLLLPFREQAGPVRVGQRVVVFVCIDEKTDRIIASARLNRYVSPEPPDYRIGQPVEFLVTGRTPLGYNAIVENAHRGLLFQHNLTTELEIGQRMKGFIRAVSPDGKIDLSLDDFGYKRVGGLSVQIIAALQRNGGELHFDDDSSPEDIRAAFGVSKKAFKQAIGKLYRERRIQFLKPGIKLLDNSAWSPGD
jgi:predicted RNA-binding protein (virulence factor B family)